MINNLQHSGYYDLDNNSVVIDDVNDVNNTTPFSVRDILNISDQNSDENSYQSAMNQSEHFAQKMYNNNGAYAINNGGSYKRLVVLIQVLLSVL